MEGKMVSISTEEEFFTPASKQLIDFRLNLIKKFPFYIVNRSSVPRSAANEYDEHELKRVSNFTTKGNIAKITSYKDGKMLLSTHRGDIAEFKLGHTSALDAYSLIYNHHNSRVSALEYDEVHDTIISGGQDGTLITNVKSKLDLHKDRIISIQKLTNSPHLISISQDGTWALVNYETSQPLYHQEGYSSPVTALSVSMYDNLLATVDTNEIQLHDLRSGNLVSRSTKSICDPCHALKLLPDNRRLLVSGKGSLKLFDLRYLEQKRPLGEILLHSGSIITSMDYKDNVIASTGFEKGSVEFTQLQSTGFSPITNKSTGNSQIVASDDKLLCCKFLENSSLCTGGFSSKVGLLYK